MIVIKYFAYLKIRPDYRDVVYELCDDTFKRVRLLSKEEAIKIIETNHLQRVHRNIYGAIWK